jgi:hypothetical protein
LHRKAPTKGGDSTVAPPLSPPVISFRKKLISEKVNSRTGDTVKPTHAQLGPTPHHSTCARHSSLPERRHTASTSALRDGSARSLRGASAFTPRYATPSKTARPLRNTAFDLLLVRATCLCAGGQALVTEGEGGDLPW